jgi:hypothetical protein
MAAKIDIADAKAGALEQGIEGAQDLVGHMLAD